MPDDDKREKQLKITLPEGNKKNQFNPQIRRALCLMFPTIIYQKTDSKTFYEPVFSIKNYSKKCIFFKKIDASNRIYNLNIILHVYII